MSRALSVRTRSASDGKTMDKICSLPGISFSLRKKKREGEGDD